MLYKDYHNFSFSKRCYDMKRKKPLVKRLFTGMIRILFFWDWVVVLSVMEAPVQAGA